MGPFHLTCRSVEASMVVLHEPRAEMKASVNQRGPITHGNFFTLSDKEADDLIHFNSTSIYRVAAGSGQEKEEKCIQNAWTLPDLYVGAMH